MLRLLAIESGYADRIEFHPLCHVLADFRRPAGRRLCWLPLNSGDQRWLVAEAGWRSVVMFSASDVSNFLACHHLSTLDRAEAAGQIDKPFFRDVSTELLQELGARHEHSYLQHLIDQGLDVAKIPTDIPWAESTTETVDAMRRKTSVIYQATFQSGPWHGRSDF